MLSLKIKEYATVLYNFLHRQLFKMCWKMFAQYKSVVVQIKEDI